VFELQMNNSLMNDCTYNDHCVIVSKCKFSEINANFIKFGSEIPKTPLQ